MRFGMLHSRRYLEGSMVTSTAMQIQRCSYILRRVAADVCYLFMSHENHCDVAESRAGCYFHDVTLPANLCNVKHQKPTIEKGTAYTRRGPSAVCLPSLVTQVQCALQKLIGFLICSSPILRVRYDICSPACLSIPTHLL